MLDVTNCISKKDPGFLLIPLLFSEYVNHGTALFLFHQRSKPRFRSLNHPFQERHTASPVLFRKHGNIKRVKRHRMPFGQDKIIFRSELLHDRRRKMPQMPRYIIRCPHLPVMLRIERNRIRYSYHQHTTLLQHVGKSFPGTVYILQMLHDMPQRNHIEAPFAVSRQRFRSLHHQLEMLLGKRPCLRALLDGRNLPSPFLHEMAEIPRTRTDIQQAAVSGTADSLYQRSLASQHKTAYIVIQAVGKSLARIRVRDIIRRFIIPAYLTFVGHMLRKQKTTRLTAVNRKFFTGGIMVRTSHDFLKMRFPAERTCIYIEYIHFIP